MKKITTKRHLLIFLVLSVLVLVCILSEAWKQRETKQEKNIVQNEKTEQTQTEKPTVTPQKVTEETNIRVLLKTDNFASLFHKQVKITSAKPFTVTVNGKKKSYKAGKTVSFSVGDGTTKKKTVTITPQNGARLKILSITRNTIHPSYRHVIQLTWKKKGFLVVNKLPLEEYLYAVVPSELSTQNNMEALKAQAVCARSFAYRQIEEPRYEQYHADLDDSVACQVYNNVPEDKRSRKAVKATRGKVVVNKKNHVIQTYYYSTSWGYSASGQDVWNTKSEVSYLKEKLQITEKSRKKTGIKSLNLSSESEFAKFISSPAVDTYDSDAEWYRWNVTIPVKSLSNRIDSALASCYASNPALILTQKDDGSYEQKPLKSLGAITKIRIEKREKSGLVTELVLIGKKNVVKVCSQYNIRKVLAPVYEQISYNNGQSQTTMSLLPSAAFYIIPAMQDEEDVFQLIGGGFGHGAGMSQCGAAKMADNGKSYREIVKYYFHGTKITSLSKVK